MRVRWFEPGDELETAHFLATVSATDALWETFARRCREPAERWVEVVRAQLRQIDAGLGLELRDEDKQQAAYVYPLAGPALLPLAELVTERAPSLWPWTFEVRRPAANLDQALEVVRDETGVNLGHARARVGVGRGHLLQIVLACDGVRGDADDLGKDAAERLVELLLGDAVLEDWVDSVRAMSAPRPSPLRIVGQEQAALPLTLSELVSAVQRAQEAIIANLPAPCHRFCDRAEWVLFEVSELAGEETPAELPHPDLQVASTMCPEMLKCFLSGSPFSSLRFSRHGERFCYLQMELEGAPQERIEQRIRAEEVLDRLLVPGGLGCVVGSGIGSRYAYVHLALAQLEAAVGVIRKRLRREQLPRRTWLLFCDSCWQNEWVGLYDDTPAPDWAVIHSSVVPGLGC